MEPSQFAALIAKWFEPVVLNRVETLNGTESPVTYLFRRFLTNNQSATGHWESLSAAYSRVMAYVVSMDSSLPKVKRDNLVRASGRIPKFGIEMSLNETQLTQLGILQRSPGTQIKAILTKIFADSERCVDAGYELMEALFLEGLSTGKVIVDDTDNIGSGFQVDFGYPTANKFGVGTLWSNTAAKPLDDFDRVIAKAKVDGKVIRTVMMDSTAFNNMIATTQFKDYFAFKLGYTGTLRTTLDMEDANKIMVARYGFSIELIDRICRKERNGVQTLVRPWATGIAVAMCSEDLGTLEYTFLAEQDNPVPGVAYTNAAEWMLLAKFRQNRPSIAEFTTVQGRALPVIANTDEIYLLDSTAVQA
jgi:hypothetical protein